MNVCLKLKRCKLIHPNLTFRSSVKLLDHFIECKLPSSFNQIRLKWATLEASISSRVMNEFSHKPFAHPSETNMKIYVLMKGILCKILIDDACGMHILTS